jgi:hypothetical protein
MDLALRISQCHGFGTGSSVRAGVSPIARRATATTHRRAAVCGVDSGAETLDIGERTYPFAEIDAAADGGMDVHSSISAYGGRPILCSSMLKDGHRPRRKALGTALVQRQRLPADVCGELPHCHVTFGTASVAATRSSSYPWLVCSPESP